MILSRVGNFLRNIIIKQFYFYHFRIEEMMRNVLFCIVLIWFPLLFLRLFVFLYQLQSLTKVSFFFSLSTLN